MARETSDERERGFRDSDDMATVGGVAVGRRAPARDSHEPVGDAWHWSVLAVCRWSHVCDHRPRGRTGAKAWRHANECGRTGRPISRRGPDGREYAMEIVGPRFTAVSVAIDTTARLGETILLNGGAVSRERKISERTPVLSALPWVGGRFRDVRTEREVVWRVIAVKADRPDTKARKDFSSQVVPDERQGITR